MIELIIFVIIILIAITVHEFSHAATAELLGDPTPRLAGRLSLNPIKHIDPLGFIMLLLVRFGWAKPVPINPYNFRDPLRGEMVVSFAGPASNFLAAWIAASLVKLFPVIVLTNGYVHRAVSDFIWINLALAIFNLLPVPPLDGSHILEPFIPYPWKRAFEQYGFFILMFILIFPPTSYLLLYVISFLFRLIT
ncbi:MAG: site-2 protease family protein [bacterium]